jgi:RNA-binding protein
MDDRMIELTSQQRKFLRSKAHHLDPAVLVGKQGITDTLVRALAQSLEAHELVKVRFNEFKSEKKALTEEMAFRTGSAVAGIIGHVAILYKQNPDEEKRNIELPHAQGA